MTIVVDPELELVTADELTNLTLALGRGWSDKTHVLRVFSPATGFYPAAALGGSACLSFRAIHYRIPLLLKSAR